MIEALKKLGESVLKREFRLTSITGDFWESDVFKSVYLISEKAFNFEYFETQVENTLHKPHVIYIDLITTNNHYVFHQITIEEARPHNNDLWIKKEAVGGSYFSPTIPLEISNSEKSMEKKTEKALKSIHSTIMINQSSISKKIYLEEIIRKLDEIREEMSNKKELIVREIYNILKDYFFDNEVPSNKINVILSLRIDKKTLKHNKLLSKYLYLKFIEKTLKINKAIQNSIFRYEDNNEKRICSLCSEQKRFITIDYKPYTFFSNDKPSYNTQSHFTTSGSMFPLDIKCAYLIEIGRCYADKYFEFKIGEENCKIIPRILFPLDQKEEESLLNLKANYYDIIKIKGLSNRVEKEESLFYALEDFNNSINYDMLFYEKNQSEFKILLYIKDIFPSQIKKIHEAFASTRKMGNSYNRKFGNLLSFYSIKRFFSRFEGNLLKYDMKAFYEMIDIIFSGKKVEKSSLLDVFFQNLPNKMFKGEKAPSQTHETENHSVLLIIELLKKLNQLKW
ncbi:MAG: TM1802 family CRISPR-associated protein [Promethearchaeota archaeon]